MPTSGDDPTLNAMKFPHFVAVVVLALAFGPAANADTFGSGANSFTIDFGSNPPPHSNGVPDSAALLADDVFSAAIYLNTIRPTSGRIVELGEGGALLTIYDFTTLVFAAYSPGGTAYSYEGSWVLAASQIENLEEGEWYAEVTYADTSYLGQIIPIPEPSGFLLCAFGLVGLAASRRGHNRTASAFHWRSAQEWRIREGE